MRYALATFIGRRIGALGVRYWHENIPTRGADEITMRLWLYRTHEHIDHASIKYKEISESEYNDLFKPTKREE